MTSEAPDAAATYTEADFDRLSWHDCHIWALELRAGDPDQDDWTSDLALDIDFIVEWLCGTDGSAVFRVAPATLVFHGATDPRIDIDWGQREGYQVALHPASIDQIEREPIANQKVFLDRPYYKWSIRLNWPQAGRIVLGAVGFTQTLRAQPVVTSQQHLPRATRDRAPRL
jgi:hypothetical protein